MTASREYGPQEQAIIELVRAKSGKQGEALEERVATTMAMLDRRRAKENARLEWIYEAIKAGFESPLYKSMGSLADAEPLVVAIVNEVGLPR